MQEQKDKKLEQKDKRLELKVNGCVNLSELLPLTKDLDSLSAADSMKFDRRSSWRFLWDTLLRNHPVFNTFFFKSLETPVIVRIWFFILEVNLAIFFSAFFVTESLIEESNLLTSIWSVSFSQSELIQAVFTMFSTNLIMSLISILSKYNEKKMARLLKDVSDVRKNYPVKGFDHFMRRMRCRLFTLLAVFLSLNLFIMYFVIIYNEVYKNSRAVWIKGIVLNWFIDWCVVEMVFPLIVTLARLVARRNNKQAFLFDTIRWIIQKRSSLSLY